MSKLLTIKPRGQYNLGLYRGDQLISPIFDSLVPIGRLDVGKTYRLEEIYKSCKEMGLLSMKASDPSPAATLVGFVAGIGKLLRNDGFVISPPFETLEVCPPRCARIQLFQPKHPGLAESIEKKQGYAFKAKYRYYDYIMSATGQPVAELWGKFLPLTKFMYEAWWSTAQPEMRNTWKREMGYLAQLRSAKENLQGHTKKHGELAEQLEKLIKEREEIIDFIEERL